VRGNISDIESLWPQGIVEFNDWTILEHQKTVARDFNGVLHVERRHLSLRKFGGAIFGGYFDSSFYADIRKSGPVTLGGKIRISDVNLTELTQFVETEKRFTRGKGYFNFRFAADINGIDSLRGNGSIYLKDADLWRVPFVGEIFKGIGVWEYRLAGISDAYAYFTLSATKMKIEEGRLSNSFSAIEAQPGGEINLSNGQIDVFVVGLGLKGIDKIIKKLPVINWVARFKDKIVRLHLKGPWQQPAVKKEPITDMKEATIVFFKSIVESGGKITGKVKDGFETVINGKENK
jgi:hypothetical protein